MAHLPFVAAAGLGLAWCFSGNVYHVPDNWVSLLPDNSSKPEIPEKMPETPTGTPIPGELVMRQAWYVRQEVDIQLARWGRAEVLWENYRPNWMETVEIIAGHYQRNGYDVSKERHYKTRHAPDGEESLYHVDLLCVNPSPDAVRTYITKQNLVAQIPSIGASSQNNIVV